MRVLAVLELPWYVLLLHAVPLFVLLWASLVIWRLGRRSAKAAPGHDGDDTPGATRWTPDVCRRCHVPTEVHGRTRLCATCHHLPLPDKAEIPDHLPERL